MKLRAFLMISLALATLRCAAQSIYTPFSWATIAGNFQQTNLQNGYGGFADGTNTQAQFGAPYSIAADSAGNLYVGDAANYAIRMMTPAGTNWVVTTIAVLPSPNSVKGPGFGTLSFNPLGVAVDTNGNVYVADSYYNAIRQVAPDGTMTTLAGNPNLTNSLGNQLGGYSNGPASVALLNYPSGLAVDRAGSLYVADSGNNVIRKISLAPGTTNWQVATLAGNFAAGFGYKDGPGAVAQFYGPDAVAVDAAGNAYVADFQNNMIRRITPDGVVSTLAGTNQGVGPVVQGVPYGNADGPGTGAEFFYPCGVAVDAATNVYVADTFNCEIRRITPDGVVTTLGGTTNFGFFGPTDPVGGYQDGISSVARFNTPTGVAVGAQGSVFVGDDSNFLIRQGSAPAVQAIAMEVTQAIQDWSNSVPLVQGKETYVRVHLQLPPQNSGPVTVSGAQLYGAGPNGALPGAPLSPINPGGSLKVLTKDATDDSIRGRFTNSLNFRLPPEWLSGTVALRCAWSGGLEAINVFTTGCVAQVTFVPAAVPRIRFFDVTWTDASGAKHQAGTNIYDLPRRLQSCYPVAGVGATFGSLHMPSTARPTLEDVNSQLGSLRFLDVMLGYLALEPMGNTIYHGAIATNGAAPPGPHQLIGLAVDIPSFVSSSLLRGPYGDGRQTASHEIGHNLGRIHDVSAASFGVNTRNEALGPCDEVGLASYVYPLFQPLGGRLKPTLGPLTNGDNSLIYGLDSLTLKTAAAIEPVLSPVDFSADTATNWYFDLMSYCGSGGPEDSWPSSVTYPALLGEINAIFDPPTTPLAARPRALRGGGGNYLVVRGTVDFNAGVGRFLPCLALAAAQTPPEPPPGTNFMLQALDGAGAVLQTIQFGLNPGVSEQDDTNQTADFILPVIYNPAIETLQLSYNGAALDTLTASPHAPGIQLTTPRGGENFSAGPVSVAWSGSDEDGDPLAYTVQFSPDGGASWQTIAVDWPGQSLALDFTEVAATTNGFMRVIASDGFNTAAAQSAAPFTVQPHAPMVNINSPPDGSVFIADQQLFLDATAFDMQDGVLDGAQVRWFSDRDGALGEGAVLTFDAAVLSEGYHTVTMTATDSAGLTNSAVTHLLELRYPPPQLSLQISPGQPNATVSWPSYYANYVLQRSVSLTSGWVAVTNSAPLVNGNLQSVSVGVSGASSFFRLVWPP